MIGTQRYQNGSIERVKNKTAPDTWFLRYYETDSQGKRVYRRRRIGTVEEYRTKREALKACESLRNRINLDTGARTPETVSSLASHYLKHECTTERKAFVTAETNAGVLRNHILPRWGDYQLDAVKTVDVELWLNKLPLAPASRTKCKAVFGALYSHAIRWQFCTFNPIQKVRTSSKGVRAKEILTSDEICALLENLAPREKALITLLALTGLRRSEAFALRWSDVNTETREIDITKSFVRSRLGPTKTESSNAPVPLPDDVKAALEEWHRITRYSSPDGFVFASTWKNGKKPLSPDMVLKRHIRPAAEKAGITKTVGFHMFRRGLSTALVENGENVKTVQGILRHSNSRTTLDVYSQSVDETKQKALSKVSQHLLAPLTLQALAA
ncbi:MAG: site-specific integrase [Acidobacteriaceae bacterium]|nr:site-specific integrase [Acidobacteriaceae bacterium]